jgi:long-chain fatty acid transport protein
MSVYNADKFSYGFGVYFATGLGTSWDGDDLVALAGPATILDVSNTAVTNPYAGTSFDWSSKIAVASFSPSVSYKLTDNFSIGASFHYAYGLMELQMGYDMVDLVDSTTYDGDSDRMVDTQVDMDLTGAGFGGTIGLMYTNLFDNKLDLGLTYKIPVISDMEGTVQAGPDDATNPNRELDMSMELRRPMWLAFGTAYRPNEKFVITADIQYFQWSDIDKFVAEVEGMTVPHPSGDGTYMVVDGEMEMIQDWEDAIQYRLGMEYKVNEDMSVLLGYYYDPAPAPDETVSILFPSSTNNAITGGMTYAVSNYQFDLGLEYVLGAERDIEASGHNMPGLHQMDIFAFSVGASYTFNK